MLSELKCQYCGISFTGNSLFCDDCNQNICNTCEGSGEVFVRRNSRGEIDYIDGARTNETARCDMCRGDGVRA